MFNLIKVTGLAVLVAISSALYQGNQDGPKQAEIRPAISELVRNYLGYQHYEGKWVTDEISARTFEKYIETLDYNKLFFLASDIEDFKPFEKTLDDDMLASPPNLKKPFVIYDRYKKRVAERVTVAMKLLDGEFDFSKEEFASFDRENAHWAKDSKELDELWRKRIKEQVLGFKLQGKEPDYYLPLLKKRYERLAKTIEENDEMDILEMFLSAFSRSFDPHSSYLKPATKDNFDIEMGHSLEGIGATLRTEGEYTVIVSLFPGGPAAKSGALKPGDKIIAVAQGDEEPMDVIDLRIDKVVKHIRGKKGTQVRLTIIPADSVDSSETRIVTITRDRVEIKDQDATLEIRELTTANGPLKVGIIEIPAFYQNTRAKFRGDPDYKSTTRDVRKLLTEMQEKGADALVVDLRQNGGGALDEAISLTGLFIESGPVVQVQGRRQKRNAYYDPDPEIIYKGPLVVLTSPISASASEIFAGAIQDYGRGLIVGSKTTHGKGTVQNVIGLTNDLVELMDHQFNEDVGGALKLTTHKFYRITGSSTQKKGVAADVVLPSPYDGLEIGEAHLDYALDWDTIEAAKHDNFNLVNVDMERLRDASQKRISKNPDFRYLMEDLAKREKAQKENRVSLNLDVRQKEKAERESIEKTRKDEIQARNPISQIAEKNEAKADGEEENTKEADEPDYILDETLQIMRDYFTMSRQWLASLTQEKK